MTTTTPRVEDDIRVKILNSFLSCPHRDTELIKKIHDEMRQKDPLFYSHLAAWYRKNGELRDHNEVFAAMLVTDPYLENRETGIALFQQHKSFMKAKIVGFIKGKIALIREKTGKKRKVKQNGKLIEIDEIKNKEIKVGLQKSIPTCLKTEITKYLRWLEADDDRFDSVALSNFDDLKTLYASKGLQIKPCKRAQKMLFEKKIPKGSKLNIFKEIAKAKPDKAAELIVANKIPYTTAIGLIEKMTPSLTVALLNNMSSQELINNISSLQEKGIMDNPETKKLVMEKLEKAKTAKNVSALKSKTAKSTGRVKDEEVLQKLDQIADTQIKKSGTIDLPTAIFVDRSGSMEKAIETGKQIAAMVSGATTADLFVVAFDTAAQLIAARGTSMTDWEVAFRPIRAGGGTSIGCALDFLMRSKKAVEQIIVVTDGDENEQPRFFEVFLDYVKVMKVVPNVIAVHVGNVKKVFVDSLKAHSIKYDIYTLEGKDYYGLPGLIPLLSRKSKLDLVYEIMAFPLPKKRFYEIEKRISELNSKKEKVEVNGK
jgi:hypothetical protein